VTVLIPVPQLNLGYRDAVNYKQRENKQIFNKIFLQTSDLKKLLEPTTFFVVGEKGTGKTAYAVFMVNNDYKNTISSMTFLRETVYQKFIELKKKNHLDLSEYSDIWKVTLYLLLSQKIYNAERNRGILNKYVKFGALQNAIEDFYSHAFSPEMVYAINFSEHSNRAAELISRFELLEARGERETRQEINFSERRFQINLLYIQRKFEEALSSLKLERNYVLFIDGIDTRPSTISYGEYLNCIKGLVDAVLMMDSDFFPSIKGSPGRLRIVLLVRPDIINSLGLQNLNSKLRDNSVLLNWDTQYPSHRNSHLFNVADNILRWQQIESLERGEAWDYYFPFNAVDLRAKHELFSSFIELLRYSLYRPRDIIVMLQILQQNFKNSGKSEEDVFQLADLQSPKLKKEIAEYFLGEIKDQMMFYYSEEEYEIFKKFFEYLRGRVEFDYSQYSRAYKDLIRFISESNYELPQFCQSSDTFLQFMYNLNVICYKESAGNEIFWRWCFRQRYYGDIAPKVKKYSTYRIHPGMRKALNIGKAHF